MSDKVVSLEQEREARREKPEWQFVDSDEEGRKLFCFSISYKMPNGEERASFMWAHSMQDAMDRVEGMRASLELQGQVIREIRG